MLTNKFTQKIKSNKNLNFNVHQEHLRSKKKSQDRRMSKAARYVQVDMLQGEC